jgi:hypothetical protein
VSKTKPVPALFKIPRVFLDYGSKVSSMFAKVLHRNLESSFDGFPKPISLEKALLMIERFLFLFGD